MASRGPTAAATRPWLLLTPALTAIVVLFLGAVVLAVIQSLNFFPLIGLDEFNLDAYRQLFTDSEFFRSLVLTFHVGITSTVLSIALGIASALVLRRLAKASRLLTFLFQFNLPVPHTVGAVAILTLLGQSGLMARLSANAGLIEQPASFPALIGSPIALGIIAEYVWKETPFIGVVALAVLQSVVADYEEVAASLGAGWWQRLRYVTLPIVLPGILSASVIVFAFTFGRFEVPLLLGRSFPSVLPVLAFRSYTNIDLAARPLAMAISVFITIVIAFCVLLYMKWSRTYIRKE